MTPLPASQIEHVRKTCKEMYEDYGIYRFFNRTKRKWRVLWITCFAVLFIVKMLLDHASMNDHQRFFLKEFGDWLAIIGGGSMFLLILFAAIDHGKIGRVIRRIHRKLHADGVIVSLEDVKVYCQEAAEGGAR